MEVKSTDQLTNEIMEATNIIDYINQNDKSLLTETLAESLSRLLNEKNHSKSDVIAASNLDQVYGYQIFSGLKKPSRDKVIALSFGLKLSLTETQHLLRTAQHRQLYPRDKRDAFIMHALKNQSSIIQINELLYDSGFEIIK